MHSLEERKLALEEQKLELETKVFLSPKGNPPSSSSKIRLDPVLATILVAVIGFFATTIGTIINNSNTHALEQRKFETELIKKSLEQPSREDILKSLKLLVTLKLIHDDEVKNALDSFLVDTVAAKESFPGFSTAIPVSKSGRETFFQLYSAEFSQLSTHKKKSLVQLFDFIQTDTTIRDLKYVAYILATIKYETADTYAPRVEFGSYEELERRYGSSSSLGKRFRSTKVGDGDKYKGRGYLMLTGKSNYQKMNTELGLQNTPEDIVQNPLKLLDPVIAYRVLSHEMVTGFISGRKLSRYINKDTADYLNARQVINGYDNAELIMNYAKKFEDMLFKSLSVESYNH